MGRVGQSGRSGEGVVKVATAVPDYDALRRTGEAFELYVAERLLPHGFVLDRCTTYREQLRIGENILGLEIKLDRRMRDTGNVYIETSERHPSSPSNLMRESGPFRPDQSWLYGIGDHDHFYIFSKRHLRWMFWKVRAGEAPAGVEFKKIGTSLGFVVPVRIVGEHVERIYQSDAPGGPWRVVPLEVPL